MSPAGKKTILFEAGAIVLLTVGILVVDVLTPTSWDVWLFYFIPLVLMFQSPRERDPFYFVTVATVLTIVGAFASHGDLSPGVGLLNRGLGVVVMWGFTWLMVNQKKIGARLVVAEAARSQAETSREAAVAARDLAEASAKGAIQRESLATRKLLVSSLRLGPMTTPPGNSWCAKFVADTIIPTAVGTEPGSGSLDNRRNVKREPFASVVS